MKDNRTSEGREDFEHAANVLFVGRHAERRAHGADGFARAGREALDRELLAEVVEARREPRIEPERRLRCARITEAAAADRDAGFARALLHERERHTVDVER